MKLVTVFLITVLFTACKSLEIFPVDREVIIQPKDLKILGYEGKANKRLTDDQLRKYSYLGGISLHYQYKYQSTKDTAELFICQYLEMSRPHEDDFFRHAVVNNFCWEKVEKLAKFNWIGTNQNQEVYSIIYYEIIRKKDNRPLGNLISYFDDKSGFVVLFTGIHSNNVEQLATFFQPFISKIQIWEQFTRSKR